MAKTVFITGASGFIGTKLRNKFSSEGWNVRGVDLKSADPSILVGNTTDTSSWEHALDDVDVVIHTAAVVSNGSSDDLMWEVNVQGTQNVAEAAARHGVKRFVHLSSIVVYGYSATGEIDETRAVHATAAGGSYVLTKVASEQAIFQTATRNRDTEFVLVRPGDVYGPGAGVWTTVSAGMIKDNLFTLGDWGRGYFRPVYNEDLVEGIYLAAITPGIGGETFNLSPDGYITAQQYFGAIYKAMGRRGPIVGPTWLIGAVADITFHALKLAGKHFEGSKASVTQLATRSWFSNTKARTMLGWEPKMPFDEGMSRTCQWMKDNGYFD